MDAHVAQWKGRRPKQEDAYAVRHFPSGALAVVCDGMGGHSAGDKASRAAADAYVAAFAESEGSGLSLKVRMHAALMVANAAVGRLFEGSDSCGGTTLLAVYISHGVLRWVSVGDSGLYVWRRDVLRRLNEDHSMRAVYTKFVCPGGMTRREAMNSGHMLRSAVTGEEIPLVDEHERPFPLLPGDRVILSTDGLEMLLEQGVIPADVRKIFAHRGGNLAAELVQASVSLDDEYADNVTVVTFDA